METNQEISIVKAQSEHSDQVIRLLKESFTPREPLSTSIGLNWDEDMTGFGSKAEEILKAGYSFVAINGQGRVVGCRISMVMDIVKDQIPEPDYIKIVGSTPKLKLLKTVFQTLMTGWTKELPDSNRILEFIVMCVEEAYGGKGIAEKLAKRSLELAEELQVDYVYTIATNCRTQTVFNKLKFDTIRTKNYDEFVDDEGNPILKMNDGSTCMKWMVKKIKK